MAGMNRPMNGSSKDRGGICNWEGLEAPGIRRAASSRESRGPVGLKGWPPWPFVAGARNRAGGGGGFPRKHVGAARPVRLPCIGFDSKPPCNNNDGRFSTSQHRKTERPSRTWHPRRPTVIPGEAPSRRLISLRAGAVQLPEDGRARRTSGFRSQLQPEKRRRARLPRGVVHTGAGRGS